MKHSVPVVLFVATLLTTLAGCINVEREVEPSTTTRTTEMRSTATPATTTTVERTSF
jgi:hypothetical protein